MNQIVVAATFTWQALMAMCEGGRGSGRARALVMK